MARRVYSIAASQTGLRHDVNLMSVLARAHLQ